VTFLRLLLCMWAWRCQLCAAARPCTHSALLACAQRIVLMLVAAEDGAAADCAYVRTCGRQKLVGGWGLCSCACSNEPAHCSCCLEVRQTMGQV
jgi:hypothetical protein